MTKLLAKTHVAFETRGITVYTARGKDDARQLLELFTWFRHRSYLLSPMSASMEGAVTRALRRLAGLCLSLSGGLPVLEGATGEEAGAFANAREHFKQLRRLCTQATALCDAPRDADADTIIAAACSLSSSPCTATTRQAQAMLFCVIPRLSGELTHAAPVASTAADSAVAPVVVRRDSRRWKVSSRVCERVCERVPRRFSTRLRAGDRSDGRHQL